MIINIDFAILVKTFIDLLYEFHNLHIFSNEVLYDFTIL